MNQKADHDSNESDDGSPNQQQDISKKDFLSWLVSVLPLLPFITAVVKYLFPNSPFPNEVISGFLLLGTLGLQGLVAITRNADARNRPLPFAATFWLRLFGRLRVTAGKSYGPDKRVNIVIVYEPSFTKQAEDIRDRYKDKDAILGIELKEINPNDSNPGSTLKTFLNKADAVYFFWTEAIRANPRISEALSRWAHGEPAKPVLIVNAMPTDDVYELKFNYVRLAQASEGLWRLLARTNERAKLWIDETQALRHWWIVTAVVAVMVVLAMKLLLDQANRRLQAAQDRSRAAEKRDQIDTNEFNTLAEALLKERKRLEGNSEGAATSESLLETLNRVAIFVVNDIDKDSEVPSKSQSELSIYRKVELGKDRDKRLITVTSSNIKFQRRKWPINLTSIVGCAAKKAAFVLWRKQCQLESEAAWNTDGDPIGVCKAGGKIEFIADRDECSFQNLGSDKLTSRQGIICFSPAMRDEEEVVNDTAVCFDTPLAPEFLTKSWLRSKLQTVALLANSIPTRALITKEDLTALSSQQDAH